eukprot:CAMPEP_0174253942 /NCGR_PEP_ID=MMETSP0439-20130205/3306_1 /TAXON_ID=0 /ORGANISM="Stereomyxa ramosa, Strain Chinc5" /LENGTH=264 /DNA_ID=CAMNT_0015335271 /DNA_START=67 /DNA_END=861 /DNA_ORIENTATION=-
MEQEDIDLATALSLSMGQQAQSLQTDYQLAELRKRLEDGSGTDTTSDELIAKALQQEDAFLAPQNLRVGERFDGGMRRVVESLGLRQGFFMPKVNSADSLSSSSEVNWLVDRKRLKKRLKTYTLREYKISGDGNCQFASLADQLYRNPDLAGVVRSIVVKYMSKHPEMYQTFVPGDFESYCAIMECDGTWGDHLTLKAAADRYGVQINLITSYKDSPLVSIIPKQKNTERLLWLSFHGELHYNSLYTEEDINDRRKLDSQCVLF